MARKFKQEYWPNYLNSHFTKADIQMSNLSTWKDVELTASWGNPH